MDLIKIKGNAYFFNAPTNSGVYVFKNKNCLIIDTGLNNGQARKLEEALLRSGFHPKYIINTHSHLDHCGGNSYFQENYSGCIVYTSELERVYLENPHIYPTTLFSSSPPKELYRKQRPLRVDFTLEKGSIKINDEKFEIIPLKGHTIDQIGIITPEKVCFLGDSIFSQETINKYGLPYLNDVGETIDTLIYLREVECEFFVPGHSDQFLSRKELLELIDLNLNNIDKYIMQIKELLDQPLTREELLENLIVLNDFAVNYTQYHLYHSSLSAFLAYLFNSDKITYSIENGKVYYYNCV
ncbi:MBL fold metallo-hydrolase [Fonticella tunisiensis]|uniref:Glyoxylase-like metal-dependent hydrolase (Beta-lactamase superfamily II) n=1 Tax=Fonticella tunisiensis TaxID=1096341 RepID=A0A4R7K8R5_9CLOT|nr:MBL fold metallo-hydrolase [Fonticella tunisiensis]TDT50397.1 glyoxylase-like metal-dependent hydrolase (beta-lactamase superfamily II) [Fonticella tunisiensis]